MKMIAVSAENKTTNREYTFCDFHIILLDNRVGLSGRNTSLALTRLSERVW